MCEYVWRGESCDERQLSKARRQQLPSAVRKPDAKKRKRITLGYFESKEDAVSAALAMQEATEKKLRNKFEIQSTSQKENAYDLI